MSTWDDLFAGGLEIHERIVALYPKLAECNALFRKEHRVSPRIPIPHGITPMVDTDRVFCALAIKAAAMKDSIVLLCRADHGEAAIALTRVLHENATLMAWQRLGSGRERLETYILFVSVLTNRARKSLRDFYEEFDRKSGKVDDPDPFHEALANSVFQGNDDTWAYFPDPNNPKKLKKVGMRGMTKDLTGKWDSFAYEGIYRTGNDHIHTSPFGIAYLLEHVKRQRAFFIDAIHERDLCLTALVVSNAMMLVVLQALDGYAGLDLEADINSIHEASVALAEATKTADDAGML